MKRLKTACAAIAAAIILSFTGCSGSPASDKSCLETTAKPTGESGLTADEVEAFFAERVPDARFIHCSIIKGSYYLDFTLSNEKCELESNYDDFALSVQEACNLFSREYSVEAKIFDITFFSDGDGGLIAWMSTDGGKSGVLTEQYLKNQKTEKSLTFDELVAFYSKK